MEKYPITGISDEQIYSIKGQLEEHIEKHILGVYLKWYLWYLSQGGNCDIQKRIVYWSLESRFLSILERILEKQYQQKLPPSNIKRIRHFPVRKNSLIPEKTQ